MYSNQLARCCDSVHNEVMKQIICIGSVLWDVIGRSASHMRQGSDVPGRITRVPGGVAFNIAVTLKRFGVDVVLLSSIGRDAEGEALIASCETLGLKCSHIYRSDDLPTDRYMGIEGANGLIAAIADSHSLEAAGDKILTPMMHGPLGTADAPFCGIISLDGNLTHNLMELISASPYFAQADLRVAPASPCKAERLYPFLHHQRAVFYVNLEEAGFLCKAQFDATSQAALALLSKGAKRVLVTNGDKSVCDADAKGRLVQRPPIVLATRVTGAGDTFMAAHIAAEMAGASRIDALNIALVSAARYVSGEAV